MNSIETCEKLIYASLKHMTSSVFLFDLKTAKPNISKFQEILRENVVRMVCNHFGKESVS